MYYIYLNYNFFYNEIEDIIYSIIFIIIAYDITERRRVKET